jgi:hypothetical protein
MESINEEVYDRDYFLSLSKPNRLSFMKNLVNKNVAKLHDPSLIKPEEQPNGNIIYHLYSDGTITRQKGGWAYGKRSVTDIESYCVKPNTLFTFPCKGLYEGDTYAILTMENCKEIKNLMNELLSEY